ncbi:MAG: hypothetical protein R2694_17575 [Ilumatobacteraceae bacterium]
MRQRFRSVSRRVRHSWKSDRPAAPTGTPTPSRGTQRDSRWWDGIDAADGCVDGFDDLAILLIAVAAFLLLWFVFPPVILLGLDLLWLAIVFVGGAVGRFLLGRPWRVEAVSNAGERREWAVRGFRGAGQLRDTLQTEFDAGLDPQPDVRA